MKMGLHRSLSTAVSVLALTGGTLFVSADSAHATSDKEMVKQGIKAFNNGEYRKTIQLMGGALSSEFNNPVVHYYLANAYAETGKTEAAIREYRIAHALGPDTDAGKFSKLALEKLTGDFKKENPEPSIVKAPPAPPPSRREQELNRTLDSLDKQASSAGSNHSLQGLQRAESYSRLADDVVNKTRLEMLKDMAGRSRNPRLTREHMRQLEQLREAYSKRQINQMSDSHRKVSEIHRTSENLKNLLQEESSQKGHRLQSRGTNLYVRNYGEGD